MDSRKRTLSEGEIDKENSPEKARKANEEVGSFMESFSTEEYRKIVRTFDQAERDDPILVLKWNPVWLQQNAQVQQQVITYLLENGGTDTEDSKFIFHFQTFQALIRVRDSMRQAIPNAFHQGGVGIVNHTLAQLHYPLLPAPIPMADAYIIMKTAVLATDYMADVAFFVAV